MCNQENKDSISVQELVKMLETKTDSIDSFFNFIEGPDVPDEYKEMHHKFILSMYNFEAKTLYAYKTILKAVKAENVAILASDFRQFAQQNYGKDAVVLVESNTTSAITAYEKALNDAREAVICFIRAYANVIMTREQIPAELYHVFIKMALR